MALYCLSPHRPVMMVASSALTLLALASGTLAANTDAADAANQVPPILTTSSSCSASKALSESLLQRDSSTSVGEATAASIDRAKRFAIAEEAIRSAPDVEEAVASEALENIHIHEDFAHAEVADNVEKEHDKKIAEPARVETPVRPLKVDDDTAVLAQHAGQLENAPEGGHGAPVEKPPPAADKEVEGEKASEKNKGDEAKSAETEGANPEKKAEGGAEKKEGKPKQPGYSRGDSTLPMRVEMLIPMSVSTIHSGSQGPLAQFLLTLKTQLCNAAEIPEARLNMLGIRGQYMKLNLLTIQEHSIVLVDQHPSPESSSEEKTKSVQDTKSAPNENKEKGFDAESESVVDFEILPGQKVSDPKPQYVYNKLKVLLSRPESPLRSGNLAEILRNAQLEVGNGEVGSETPQNSAKQGCLQILGMCLLAFVYFV